MSFKKLVSITLAAVISTLAFANLANSETSYDGEFWNNGVHYQLTGDIVTLVDDGIHDPYNSAVAGILQQPVAAMVDFPRDAAGIIDWVKTLDSGMIAPRSDVTGEAAPLKPLDLDIVFKNTAAMPYVKFSHKVHTAWLTCTNCHPDVFIQKQGANNIKMVDVLNGKFCGLCHGKVAFPPTKNCMRCHSVPQK